MGKKILIIMTGSIAAYKACGILSGLKQKNHELEVIMTPSCLKFIGAATVEGLTGKSPVIDMYEPGRVMDHIHLQRWADLILVAPATAHFINRLAVGIGDDLATTLFLAHDFQKPFLIAPAMNTKMYLHPLTQKAMTDLKKMGVEILESASGVLACGEMGWGRLLEPSSIVQEVEKKLTAHGKSKPTEKKIPSIPTKKILITSGGTFEPVDAVRTLTNESTGNTGYAIAQSLYQLGYDVQLLMSQRHQVLALHRGESALPIKFFSTFKNLSDLIKNELAHQSYDVVIHAAAVSDFHADVKFLKQKTDSKEDFTLRLKRNPKIIHSIKKWSLNKKIQLVGFKLTANLKEEEISKKVAPLFEKACADLVIQNDTSQISKDPQNPSHRFHLYSSATEFQTVPNTQDLIFSLSQFLQQGAQI